MELQQVEKVYDFYSGVYDSIFGRVFEGGRESAPDRLDLFPGARLLEVGIGTGLSLRYLPRDVEITGIDLSQKMLGHAEKRVRSLRLDNVHLLKMDATKLEFADRSFDRVLAAYFISTVPDPVAVIREMKRVCRPGGVLLFLNHFHSEKPIVRAVETVISPLCFRLGFRTDLDLQKLARDADLKVESVERIDFCGHWRAVRCIND